MESPLPGQTSQLAPRMAATPKDDKCNMKIMRKHVVNKLSPYWSVVCQHLGYSTAGLVQDDKKNLIAVLEHWINSGEKEGKPRTWSMFMGVLSNISELSIVTSDICRDLNTAGVYFTSPPSISHVLVPLLVQGDTLSLTKDVDDKYSQLPAGMAATPSQSQCNMKAIHKHVASHLSPYWILVCHHLSYSAAERDRFRGVSDKKSLIAVLEHWINSGEKEGKPRTWSMFIGELSNISELSTVTNNICMDLNSAGVCITPPSSRPHDPSSRQPEAPLLVQDNISSLTEVSDGPNKPTTAQSTPPTQKPLNMKIMYRCVISKLSLYWTSVGDYLEYSVAERNSFKGASNKKSLAALLENWISTTNGRKPKTWLTFFKVLSELDQDLSMSVGREICASIQAELAASSTPAQQRPSERSASDSVPPQQRHQEQLFKHSLSFPAVNYPNKAPYQNRQHSDDDVRKKLDYDTSQMPIAEENSDWSLPQPKHGQSHDTVQLSHGQKSTATPIYTIGPPPTANVRSSVAPPPSSMMAGLQNIQRPFHPSSNQWRRPLHGYQPAPPTSSPLFPTQDYSSMGSPQAPLPMGFPQDHPSVGLYSLQHSMYCNVHPNPQFQRSPRPFHPSQQRKQYRQTQSGDPQSLRQPRPQKDPRQMHSMYPQVDQQRYDTQQPHLIQGPHPAQGPHSTQGPHPTQGPHLIQGPHPAQGPHSTQGPYSTQGPPSMQGPYPRQGPHSAQRLYPTQGPPYRRGQPPGQAVKQNQSLQAQQGTQHLLQSRAQAMEQQRQQAQPAAQQEPCPQQDQQPQDVTSHRHDNTNYQNIIHSTRSSTAATMATTTFAVAMITANSKTIVINTTVTNMNTATMSPTSSCSSTTSPTKTTERWPVWFSQSPTTTQRNVQSTARTISVTSSVTTAITVSSPTSGNTLRAINKEVCPISDCKPLSRTFDHCGGTLIIEEHDVTITVPELAVSRGEEVEIQAVASLIGPYKLPNDYKAISVFVWIAADYMFKKPVRITIPHFASIGDLDEISDVAVLTANEKDLILNENGDIMLQMHKSVYDYHYEVNDDYCDYYTNHFCSKCLARRRSFIVKLFNRFMLSSPREVSNPNPPREVNLTRITVFFCVPEDYETADELLIEICICYSVKHCLQERTNHKDSAAYACAKYILSLIHQQYIKKEIRTLEATKRR